MGQGAPPVKKISLFRLQAATNEPKLDGDCWVTSWYATVRDGTEALKEAAKMGWAARLERIEVSTTEDIVYVMNHVDVNFVNMPGELVAKVAAAAPE